MIHDGSVHRVLHVMVLSASVRLLAQNWTSMASEPIRNGASLRQPSALPARTELPQ